MNFEVDRYSSAWAHIALCADLTWATEPPDEYVIANQRLWAQHCRVTQTLQDAANTAIESSQLIDGKEQTDSADKSVSTSHENNNCCKRNVKDVIPESRLARYYGNFYYDEARENCYTASNEKFTGCCCSGQSSENSDITECWMLPEVEYWFRKLVDDSSDRSMPRRRRQYRTLVEGDFGRLGPSGADEAALEARVRSVRSLWSPATGQSRPPARTPSPPGPSRKIRARRRQPRRLASFAPPPSYCLEAPVQLCCDPACKFQFDSPRLPNVTECQRAIGRLSASVQAIFRANAVRCPLYRGTNVSRYAPTGPRPIRCPDRRYGVWWPRDHLAPTMDRRFHTPQVHNITETMLQETSKNIAEVKDKDNAKCTEKGTTQMLETNSSDFGAEKSESKHTQREKIVVDGQSPCTSAAALDSGLRKKRLYSTVLSTSAPAPINLPAGCVRLSQKLMTPGLLKLNPKIVLQTRIRSPNADIKFEELEKEALEQYKASDESIDTKFRELEKQAVEQYSTSNSNTSCSSGNSTEKRTHNSPTILEVDVKTRSQTRKLENQEKSVDSVVIYSQNFPDLKGKTINDNVINLKNFHNPPRGEKKEQIHRFVKNSRNLKNNFQHAASDTDYEAREVNLKGNHKGPMRWTLHVMPPKKRHLNACASDYSSDEELDEPSGSIKDAGPCMKNHVTGKLKMSAHGGGDLNPIMRKT